jgi:hypothetical protein
MARTPRTEQCARPASPTSSPVPLPNEEGCTEAVDVGRFGRITSAINLVLCRIRETFVSLRRTAKAP